MGKNSQHFAKGNKKAQLHSQKMIKKTKIKSKKTLQADANLSKIENEKTDEKQQLKNSQKSLPVKKLQGVKRKLEEFDSQNNQSKDADRKKKFKKRKLKDHEHGDPGDSSKVKADDLDTAKSSDDASVIIPAKPSSERVLAGFKNKMNQQPDKNWEALLKILPKEAPKKKEVPKKNLKKKTWRKPLPKQQAHHPKKSQKDSSKCLEDVSDKKIKREDIWFDDVDDLLIEGLDPDEATETDAKTGPENPLVKDHSFEGATRAVAMDCEMVGVGDDGIDSVLARVSIVNRFGHVLLDKYVKPREKVTDYRTHVSGIRPSDLKDAEDFMVVQKEVHKILKGRILVGHALNNDMQVLFMDHPRKLVRDTARYKPFRKLFNGRIPSLKNLTAKLLSVEVQTGEHNSVQDAQAAMRIYTMHRAEWEKLLKSKINERPISKKEKAKKDIKKVLNTLESDSDS